MAGVGFDDQPDFVAGGEVEGVAGGEGDMDFELHADVDDDRDHDVALREGGDSSGEEVARAEAFGALGGEQDVAGANADAQVGAFFRTDQWRFEFDVATGEFAGHGAALFVGGDNGGVENVFEPGKVRDGFLARRVHHFVRRALREHAALIKDDDAFAESKDFLAAVRDVKNRNAVGAVPGAQVVEDVSLGGRVERSERFVQQQDAGIGHERARQGDPLALASGNFLRATAAQPSDAKGVEDRGGAVLAILRVEAVEAIENVGFDAEMRKQRGVLKNVTDIAATHGQVDASLGVEEHAPADANAARVGADEAGDAVEQRGLARAGGAEQDGEAGRRGDFDIEQELTIAGVALLKAGSERGDSLPNAAGGGWGDGFDGGFAGIHAEILSWPARGRPAR